MPAPPAHVAGSLPAIPVAEPRVASRRYVVLLLALFGVLQIGSLSYSRLAELSCWSGGYARDAWLAYCNSDRYGVYDVDAIWFRLQPEVAPAVARAQVLQLTDSHLQSAFGLADAAGWFEQRHVDFYSLGIATTQSGFGEKLIDEFQPHPKVLLLDTSPYFTGRLGFYQEHLVADPAQSRAQAESLAGFQAFHEAFCNRAPWFCSFNFAYFRSRRTGSWIFPPEDAGIVLGRATVPNDTLRFPVGDPPDDVSLYPGYLTAARRLLAKLDLRPDCVVITHVPTDDRGPGIARYLARELGATLDAPDLPGLYTFDRSHLTPDSSRRWVAEYLRGLQPVLDRCL